jgi:hypothetical protein
MDSMTDQTDRGITAAAFVYFAVVAGCAIAGAWTHGDTSTSWWATALIVLVAGAAAAAWRSSRSPL